MLIGEKEAIGAGAVAFGWLTAIFTQGRRVGRVEEQFKALVQKVDGHEQELGKLKALFEEEIGRLRVHHEEDMKRFREFFYTPTGGQKFITFPDHDGMCERNNKLVVKAVENLTAAMKENTEVVSKMGDQIHTLKVDVAVLKDRRNSGRRSDEGKEEHDTNN
jgi:hypothetical protein